MQADEGNYKKLRIIAPLKKEDKRQVVLHAAECIEDIIHAAMESFKRLPDSCDCPTTSEHQRLKVTSVLIPCMYCMP